MAVTKTMPYEAIEAAFASGITLFGENRVQELCEKLPKLDMTGRSAHIIGHLQTNKVKYIIDKADMIQSVDSLKLAKEIERQAAKIGRVMDILVEVNIGREESKSGVMPEKALEFAESLSQFSHIKLRGFMAIPPADPDKEKSRPYFKQMYQLFVDIRTKKSDNISIDTLSMGMSSDFEVAVQEGATIVRVGTAIFGKRNYNI
jgi:pyridoxal phosphate enzyme (YggS family)